MLHRPTIKARAGASGRYLWDLLDEDGRPDPAATRAAGGGRWRKNLITDAGLLHLFIDPAGASASLRKWYGYNATGSSQNLSSRGYLVLGDGATPPDPADTTLEALVAYTGDTGGFGGSTFTTDAGDDLIVTVRHTRVYTAAAAVSVREWGYSPNVDGSPVLVRELFRDGADNPVTVSLQPGRKLRHVHDLSVRIPKTQPVAFDVEEFDVGGNLVTTHSITGVLSAHVDGGHLALAALLQPGQQPYGSMDVRAMYYYDRPATPSYTTVPTGYESISGTAGGGPVDGNSRAWLWQFAETVGNDAPITGLMLRCQTGFDPAALLVRFDEPHELVKTNLQTLELGLSLSFTRDA